MDKIDIDEVLGFLQSMIGRPMPRKPGEVDLQVMKGNGYPFSTGSGNDIGDWVDQQAEGGPSAHLIFQQLFGAGEEGQALPGMNGLYKPGPFTPRPELGRSPYDDFDPREFYPVNPPRFRNDNDKKKPERKTR